MDIYIYTYIHIYIHTYTHMYIYVYIGIPPAGDVTAALHARVALVVHELKPQGVSMVLWSLARMLGKCFLIFLYWCCGAWPC